MPAKRSPEVLQALSLIREGFSASEAAKKTCARYNTVMQAVIRERKQVDLDREELINEIVKRVLDRLNR